MSRNVAELIIATLEHAGAKRCYGLPGDTLNLVTDAIRRSTIRFIHVRHEEAGGFAAGADALVSDELVVCAGSCGPGSLHFINGLFDAHRNRAPVVLIASQLGRDELGTDFPQEVDFKPLYQQASVFCQEVRTAEAAGRIIAMAVQAALNKRGVAVVILPADVASLSTDEAPRQIHRATSVLTPVLDEIAKAVEIISRGRKIAIYGGSGCQHAHEEVIALAAKLKAPVAYTSRAKDFLEPNNPFAVGMTGIFGVKSGFDALMECDTLILLGCDFAWRQFYPGKATIIQIDTEPTHLGRRHPIDLGLAGDVGPTLQLLLPGLVERADTGFLEKAGKQRFETYHQLEKRAVASTEAIHPQYVTTCLAEAANEDAIWTADGGTPMVWLLRHVSATGRNRTLLSLTHGSMANALPYALGAAAARPDCQVICLSGDGGLTMLLGDLLTAVQEELNIKVVVFNNGSLAFVDLEQKVEGLLNTYTDLRNPDFGALARAMGLWGERVEEAADLPGAITRLLEQDGPALLDVVVDGYELVVPPHVSAGNVGGTALYAAKALLAGEGREAARLITHNLPVARPAPRTQIKQES
ncbi:thiamine pyrophosphate-binding protein [Sphingomonas sp. BN140010]|uniref:Thiamine pyrophosphate-binding protein n=1 Tax=Sphingomonas arvum TaxID=2992113 RepID=A0ABT3JDP8_9SPHN|nr:thiamine pyrophosphate-dependent enzyme [Sphingomonas sp. BN140010]MCW3797195.1 thiamine pyrophosphate-binding protein [Sphingomonas sp. BN140010]